ncbi:uncharacterized protein LOC144703887 isoform X2 [Wolffia australiana]
MEHGRIVAICQYGGEFTSNGDGSLTYGGGDAHIVDIDHTMPFETFKAEIAGLFDVDSGSISIKYFLPNNRKTLITVSSDKDLKRMINFHADSETTDVYILNKAEKREITGNSGEIFGTSASADRIFGQHKLQLGRNGNGANVTWTGVADGSISIAAGVQSENGRKRRVGAIDRLNYGSSHVVDPAVALMPIPDPTRPPALMTAIDCDYNRDAILSGVGDALSTYSGGVYDDVIYVGQEFDNVKVFRDELCKFAFLKGFKYRFIKNEHSRLTAKCAEDTCPWRIHASQSSRKKTFVIKKMNPAHTCRLGYSKDRRATTQWLASIIKDKLRESPHLRPKDIVADLFRDYGISLNYHQAWRGKEMAQKELFTLHEEACNQLPWYCERVIETNPGSVAMLAASADSKFRRVFISLYASLRGFDQACRPLLFLDKVPLKSNLQWKLLAAAAVDADDAIFPLAFAAVEAETYDSWLWFLVQLKYAVPSPRPLTFVTPRGRGLDQAVAQVFDGCFHAFCLNQLLDDFQAELSKGPWSDKARDAMAEDLRTAAQAGSMEEFTAHMARIRAVSKEAADWAFAARPETWSNAAFKGQRYEHYSPQMVKSLSSWIPVKHEASVVLIIDAVRDKLMELMRARRAAGETWAGPLTPAMEEKLKKEIPKAAHYVVCSSDTVFEVRWNAVHVVDIGAWECTCRRWQMTGLPCTHAMTVFDRLGKNVYEYCSRYLTAEIYRTAYAEDVRSIPDVERMNSIFTSSYPPRSSRPPDRPRRKRVNPNKTTIRALRCSRCKALGHNKATCEAFL